MYPSTEPLATRPPLRISIVTPNFNSAEYVQATVASVVEQAYPNLDYLFIDGGSSDGSLEVVDPYRAHFSHLISERDRGHADALSKGFALSDGEIMGWINSDDILLPGSLAAINRIFQSYPHVEWITGRPTAIAETGVELEVQPVKKWSRLRFMSGQYRWIQQESTFWRRSLWERAGATLDTTLELANDFELWLRFFRFADLYTVDRILGSFRRREGQRSIAFRQQYEEEARGLINAEYLQLPLEFRKKFCHVLPSNFAPMARQDLAINEKYLSVDDVETIRNTRRVNPQRYSLSVVTPSFNQAPFLPQCIKSVSSQSASPIEHLIFDPGSTDGSRDIAAKSPTVTLIAERDKGQADAVARGFRMARGDIICWLNSDDEYADENVFAAVIERFSEDDCPGIVYGRANYVDEVGRPLRSVFINSQPTLLPHRLLSSVGISQPATFIHRSVIDRIGVPDESLHFAMDYEYWLRAVTAGVRFGFLDRRLANSRYYADNKTAGQRNKSYLEILAVVRRHAGYVADEWLHRYADFLATNNDGILNQSLPHQRSATHADHFRQLRSEYGSSRA